MKPHNRILFHCLCCGRVVHAELEQTTPNCCGELMINAAAETVWDCDEPFVGQAAEQSSVLVPRKPANWSERTESQEAALACSCVNAGSGDGLFL